MNPGPESKAPAGLPTYESLTDIPLPSAGSLRSRFPGFSGTMEMCDSPCPSRRASFPSLGDTLRRACRFDPDGPGRPTAGQGFVSRSPLPATCRRETSGASQVPGESWCAYALLSDPGRSEPARPYGGIATAPVMSTTKATRDNRNFGAPSHGLGTRCLRFARWVTHTGRKTRFPLLATLWDGIGCPQDSNGRFLTQVILLSQAFLAQGHSTFPH